MNQKILMIPAERKYSSNNFNQPEFKYQFKPIDPGQVGSKYLPAVKAAMHLIETEHNGEVVISGGTFDEALSLPGIRTALYEVPWIAVLVPNAGKLNGEEIVDYLYVAAGQYDIQMLYHQHPKLQDPLSTLDFEAQKLFGLPLPSRLKDRK